MTARRRHVIRAALLLGVAVLAYLALANAIVPWMLDGLIEDMRTQTW